MTATTQRPPAFDAQLLAYLPMLWKKAKRLVPLNDQEDLVNSTIAHALRKWENQRDGFVSWLRLVMISEFDLYKKARRGVTVSLDRRPEEVQLPSQEHAVAVRQALAACSDPDLILAVATGQSNEEIGLRRGISKQAVNVRLQRERARLSA